MKILLDPQIFNSQRFGGISRYFTEVFSVLSNRKNISIRVPLNNSTNTYFNESILYSNRQKIYFLLIKILNKFRLSNKIKLEDYKNKYLAFILNKQDYDLFVPTYYDTYFLKNIGSKPFVLTVYDMIHELFPEYFMNDEMVVRNKLLLMEKANRIIAVSENTKKDILKIYPHIDKSKIDVVYHGCSLKPNHQVDVCLPKKYILFVGNRDDYKNFRFFVESITELLKKDSDLYLICAGAGIFKKEEYEFIAELGLKDKIIQKNFKDDELVFFYTNAKCFVFPSLYEGFGLPVVESMICGCPVVLAKHSSFPEVAGDAGVYFELNNHKDLYSKIEKLINNESYRQEFSTKGIEQAKKFSWEIAANQCLDVYKKSCKN
jgi:glycosyltransferase involved in cell wall biosynthesis